MGIRRMIILTAIVTMMLALGYTVWIQKKTPVTQETFFRQNIQEINILLADKGGSAFVACMQKGGKTQLVSILPTAVPRGEDQDTFRSVFQKEGVRGLKEKAEKSLSCNFSGYLIVDISGLAPLVDALEGVELNGKIYSGQEMVAYFKNLPPDREGAYAQQDVLLAIGRRFCAAGFWKGQTAMGKLLQITETDLSVSNLIKLGTGLIPALEGKDLSRHCLPDSGQWTVSGSLTAAPGKNKCLLA